jgi:hypothetical protein
MNAYKTSRDFKGMKNLSRIFCVLLLAWANSALADDELAVAAQKSNNPLSDAWLLVVQNDFTVLRGDAVPGSENLNNLKFQPVMAFPVFDDEWNFILRPVIQLISAPLDKDLNSPQPFKDRTNGFGDTVLLTLLGPNRDDGTILGFGPTFIVPTATEDVLGQEKWQAGPAALLARLGKESGGLGLENWNIGVLPQQWWSFAGDSDREAVSQMDIQYFVNWRQNATRLIGMTPNIKVNWKESGSDKFSLPVGIGVIDMMRMGKTPVRWGIELQYYVMQPDLVAPTWNLRFFFAPIAKNPYKKGPEQLALSGLFDKYAGR